MDSSWALAVASHVHEMGVAEAHGNRTHPSRRNRDANGFEVREGHQAPGASEPIMSERVEEFTSRVLFCAAFAWGCSSAGRAPEWHSGGRRFDPVQLHQLVASARLGSASAPARGSAGYGLTLPL